jgi:5-hydroxyisourate hydrolase-like protein (transthyretin family)
MSSNFSNSIKGLALFSLLLALVGAALISPSPASAATCRPGGAGLQSCTSVTIHVFDRLTGSPIDNAKVALVDSDGNVTHAYDLSMTSGIYAASVTPSTYRVVVTAPAYFSYTTDIQVQDHPASANAPLVPSTIDGYAVKPASN